MFAFLNRSRHVSKVNRGRASGAPRQRRWQPQIEELEQRTVPALVSITPSHVLEIDPNLAVPPTDTVTLRHDATTNQTVVASNTGVVTVPDSLFHGILLNAGIGDTDNILSTPASSPLSILGSYGFGSHDHTVNLGDGGSVQGILSSLTIENPPSRTTVIVNDSNDGTFRPAVTLDTVSLYGSAYGQLTGLGPAPIQFKYVDTSSVTVMTGSGGATVNVLSTGVLTKMVGNGFFNDTVNVGNSIDGVQDIWGQLNVANPSNYTTLNVNDSADSWNRYVDMSVLNPTTGIISGFAPADITFELSDLSALNVTSGGPGTFDVFWVDPPLTTHGWPLTFHSGGGSFLVI